MSSSTRSFAGLVLTKLKSRTFSLDDPQDSFRFHRRGCSAAPAQLCGLCTEIGEVSGLRSRALSPRLAIMHVQHQTDAERNGYHRSQRLLSCTSLMVWQSSFGTLRPKAKL